jgi:hypothetical protein
MPHAHAERPVDVLDQREVVALDDVLLHESSAVQSNLLGVLEETRVRESELSLETGLLGGVATERWCGPFDCSSELVADDKEVGRDVRRAAEA